MHIDDDHIALAKFSPRVGEAFRTVLAHEKDIFHWIDEGWCVVAIYRLLKSKGIVAFPESTFRRAVKRVFALRSETKSVAVRADVKRSTDNKAKPELRPRPHEVQRKLENKFVTFTGVDHIGLDKKDD